MPSLLALQFRKRPELIKEERQIFYRETNGSAVLKFRNAFDESIEWSKPETLLTGHDGVILAGSGEFDFDGGRSLQDEHRSASHTLFQKMTPFLRVLFSRDFPTLGICYGHQILGHVAGAEVVHDGACSKVGSYEVVRHPNAGEDPVFAELPAEFIAQYAHKDSLDRMPEGASVLATGTQCPYAALRYGANIYSVQFHPELNSDDLARRLSNTPGYLPEHIDAEDVIQPSPHAAYVFESFLRLIAKSNET